MVLLLLFLPEDKHTGSSQYDVYSLDGMAGDGQHEDGEEVKGGVEERRRVRRGVKDGCVGCVRQDYPYTVG